VTILSDHPSQSELRQHEIEERFHWFEVDRREFFKVLGGGLFVCFCARDLTAQESGRNRRGHELPKDIAAWLRISESGAITVYTGKVEMGQNIRTSLAQQVAEELRVPIDLITMIMGDTALTPWDAGTFGSRTTPTMGPQLKNVAITARETLIAMAAERWKVDVSLLSALDGKVVNHTGQQSISYGELTHGQNLVKVISDPSFTPAGKWTIAGTPVPKVDGREFVTGKHEYTSDLHPVGMLFGKVLRPAGFNAKLASAETHAAEKLPGATVVRDGDFIGVVASTAFDSERAIEAIKAEWTVPAQPSNRELFTYLKKNSEPNPENSHITGSVDNALASSDVKLEQTYTVQYIAHAPLEPRAAVAEWKGNKLTVWTGTQRPFAVRDELAEAFRIGTENVRVLVPDTGSAYGGKHTGDAAVEAARLAKACGKPVKVVWTREEEFTWAYFRPAGVINVRSGAHKDGSIVAWEFHNYNSGSAGIETPYSIPNQTIQFHPVKSPLRQGSYRALAATANNFARESHMNELATELSADPLELRLKHISDPRLRAVFETAADRFGWNRQQKSPGRGSGIAGGFEKLGYIAMCAEVEIDPAVGKVRITRVVAAFECGAVVNPNGLENQVSGAIVQGIGGALFEAINFENGKILNPHFSEYRVPRFSDLPDIEVILVNRKDLPSVGAGECPIIALAPALAAAIFAATGTRLRSLPLAPDGIRKT
jgi:isoquinoline 1-oxidoreductase